MEDQGDPRYHLPRNRCLITPERAAKGDLNIEFHTDRDGIRFVQAQVRNILNFLHERGVLDHQHVHDGETFQIWQMWFTAELSCRPSTIYSPDMRGIRRMLAEDDLAHEDYGKLMRGMSKVQLRCVEAAVKTPATEHNIWLAVRDVAHYREAFDRLGVVMERLRAQYKARQEAESENLR